MSAKKAFISYNHADRLLAERLKSALEKRGILVTIDSQHMEAGASIQEFIESSIRDTDATLSIISNRSLLSGWVAAETVTAFYNERLRGDKRFIACYIDDDFFKSDFRLRATEEIDSRIQQIEEIIPKHFEKKLDTSDLNTEKSRLYKLRNNLGDILQQLKDSLTLDMRESEFDRSLDRIIQSIEKIPSLPIGKQPVSVSKDPRDSNGGLKFVSVGIHHRSVKYWREGECSEHRSKISNKAAQYFHMTVFESDSDFWKEHRDPVNADPLFDITVKNESGRSLIFLKVGIVISVVANSNYLWGLPTTVRIPLSENYAVKVPKLRERFRDAYDGFELKPKRLDEVVWMRVPDPYALEQEAQFRYTLRLKNYCENMPNHARLQMWCETDHGEFRSGEIALLRY